MDELQKFVDDFNNKLVKMDGTLFAEVVSAYPDAKDCIMSPKPSMLFYGHRDLWQGILVCERGAKDRNLNLDIASEDSKRWWETGKVPLRATPIINRGL